jgi:hypothetical protein
MATTMHATDEVRGQLRDLERQGGGMAQLAHIFAAALLFAFSLGSLISISATPFFRFLRTPNLPDAISIAVNVLLVISADVALLYAASQLRVLVTAQAPASEQRIHRIAMIGAASLESATYLYLVWTFDKPGTAFLWAIGVTRAVAAPLCAAYLSMARPLPVGPRDVAYQASLAAGKGVVRDVTTLAGDPTAPLSRKVRIYNAASVMSAADRERFASIIDAVAEDTAEGRETTPPHPTGGLPITPAPETAAEGPAERYPAPTPLRMISGVRASAQTARRNRSRMDVLRSPAFAALNDDPTLTRAELRKLLRTRQSTANALYNAWKMQQPRQQRQRA